MTNPSTLIFLGLAVVWAIVLLPEGIKKLSKVRRSDSIRSFNHQLSVLDRSGSARRPAGRPMGRSNVIDLRDRRATRDVAPRQAAPAVRVSPATKRRRQEVTAVLAAVAVLTLLCVVAFGAAFLVFHLLADALLVGYLFLVAQANKSAARPASAVTAPYRYQSSSVTRLDSNGFRPLSAVGSHQRNRRSV